MSQTEPVASAIDLPPELRRLITDYIEKPHVWSAFETVRCSTIYPTESADATLTVLAGVDDKPPFDWRMLASSETFRTSHLNWSVEFKLSADVNHFIGFGVTSAIASSLRSDVVIAAADDWILVPNLRYFGIYALLSAHNSHTDIVCDIEVVDDVQNYRVQFEADPINRTVTAQILRRQPDDSVNMVGRPVSIFTGADQTDFLSLRPCVFLAATTSAIVRSFSKP